jgi:hypothetical protein
MAGYGMQGHMLIQMQNSYGTLLTTSLEAVAITDESVTYNIEQIQENTMYSRFAQSPTHQGATMMEGTINMEADPKMMGFMFRTLCSSYSVTGSMDHTFQLGSADFDATAAGTPFTAELNRDVGSAFLFYDLQTTALTLNAANGELVNVGIDVMGAGFSNKASGTPSYPTGQKMFKWDQASVSYNGAALADLRDFTMTVNKNLEAIHTLQNTNSPAKIKRNDNETIELNGTLLFQSHSYFQAYTAQSEAPLVINFASNSPNNLLIEFPAVKFESMEPVMDGKTFIEADFTATAHFSTTSNTAMYVVLTNGREESY